MSKKPGAFDKHVGHLIRSRRLQLGLKQVQVAEALGISQQQIVKFELGYSKVNNARLAMIARTLGVETAYFFTGLQQPGDGADNGAASAPTLIESLAHPDCVQLVQLFDSITDKRVRRMIVELVTNLAQVDRKKTG